VSAPSAAGRVEIVAGAPPADATRLRRDVFVGEQGVDPQVEADAHDRTAQHAVVRGEDGAVLATGRLLDPGGDLARGRVGRMAVAPAHRGAGHGAVALRALEVAARARGLIGIELHAQEHAAGFYDRQGYGRVGEPFLEEGIAHITMVRDWLPGIRPVTDADASALQQLIGGCYAEYEGCVLDLADLDAWMTAPASTGDRTLWVVPGPEAGLTASVGHAHGELKSLYVTASARGSGLGESLVRLAERAGTDHLWSDTRFTDAHRLYSRLGWTRTGRQRELHDPSHTTEWEFVRPP
jgi:predicted GNAT family N-acyltransferase